MSSRRDATWPPGTLARAFANSPKLARDDKERNGVTTSFNPFRGRGRERVNAYPRDVSELTRIPLEGHGVRGVVCPRRRQGRHSQHTKSGTGAFGYIAGLCFRICVAAPPLNRPHRGRFSLRRWGLTVGLALQSTSARGLSSARPVVNPNNAAFLTTHFSDCIETTAAEASSQTRRTSEDASMLEGAIHRRSGWSWRSCVSPSGHATT